MGQKEERTKTKWNHENEVNLFDKHVYIAIIVFCVFSMI